VSKRRRRKGRPSSRSYPRWLPLAMVAAVAAVAVAVIGGGALVAQNGRQATVIPVVTGAPRVAVAQEVVDYGEVKVNTPIETVFRVQNIGDQPLKILGEPQVELVEGC